jgi:hypothetical protein
LAECLWRPAATDMAIFVHGKLLMGRVEKKSSQLYRLTVLRTPFTQNIAPTCYTLCSHAFTRRFAQMTYAFVRKPDEVNQVYENTRSVSQETIGHPLPVSILCTDQLWAAW